MTITKEEVQKLLDRMTFECVNCEMDHALAEDIGKTLIAESARADQAEAAMAAMVERCAEAVTPQDVYGDGRYFRVPGFHQAGCAYKDNDLVAAANIAVERIRALASPSGLAMLAELRAERDAADQRAGAMLARIVALEADGEAARSAASTNFARAEAAEAARDTLAATNAALEARVAELEEALIWCSGSNDFQVDGQARAGWLKLCAPLITPAALASGKPGEAGNG